VTAGPSATPGDAASRIGRYPGRTAEWKGMTLIDS
jgi:hypothetical protein